MPTHTLIFSIYSAGFIPKQVMQYDSLIVIDVVQWDFNRSFVIKKDNIDGNKCSR